MSTTPGLDVRDHIAAAKALLAVTMVKVGAVGDYSQIPGGNWQPGKVPGQYALVAVERRIVTGGRLTGQAGRSSWRLLVRWVGNSADNALRVQWAAAQAFDEARMVIGPHRSTPLQLESSTSPEFDDGTYSGLSVFTYTL